MQSVKNRVIRLERYRPRHPQHYQLAVTVLLPDSATDDELAAKKAKYPDRRYVRESDFLNECC